MASISGPNPAQIDHQGDRMAEVPILSPAHHHGLGFNVAHNQKEAVTTLPQPDLAAVLSAMEAELEAARARIVAFGQEAEARDAEIEAVEWQAQALQAERDAARRAQMAEREKAEIIVTGALKRTLEAIQRAEKAETMIRQTKVLPGVKGWLVRYLARERLIYPHRSSKLHHVDGRYP